jgi:hypothetical protein
MRSTQRDAIKLAQRFGLEVLSLSQTGGDHYKLNLRNSQGSTAFFVMSNTASDKRHATKNNKSLFRRFADGTFNPVKERGQKR